MNPCPIIPEAPNTTTVFDMTAFLVVADVTYSLNLLDASKTYPIFYIKAKPRLHSVYMHLLRTCSRV
jgi:hypothetical protein